MSRNKRQEIEFINTFVDSVTVRPFFEGLRRVQRSEARYAMPVVRESVPAIVTEAA